jgi:hypothetical protein
MDDRSFDSLILSLTTTGVPRRLTLTGLLGAALGLGLGARAGLDADAKKHGHKHKHRPKCKRKKKCKPHPPDCTPDCSGQTCGDDGCGGICACADPSVCDNGDDQCCDPEGVACTHFSTCCSKACDTLVGGGTCASCRGWYCDANYRCCGDYDCVNNRCDGCYQRAIVCTSSEQCCFSECTEGACLSGRGGRCDNDADCEACYLHDNCANACVNGSCAF